MAWVMVAQTDVICRDAYLNAATAYSEGTMLVVLVCAAHFSIYANEWQACCCCVGGTWNTVQRRSLKEAANATKDRAPISTRDKHTAL